MQPIVKSLALIAVLCGTSVAGAQWKPAKARLMSRWAKDVSPEKVHPEYPRPQMVRPEWQNLNGLWEYAIRAKDEKQPGQFDGELLVPFPVESALSGVMKRVGEENRLWYRRSFGLPEAWREGRVLLHFGAVDWDTTVWVNGEQVGTHRGGYDPFSFDVTDALKDGDKQGIVVSVWDPTDAGYQPRGKQVNKPRGIWYTPTTGIWQTVWLEPVSKRAIAGLKITPDVDRSELQLTVETRGDVTGCSLSVQAADGDKVVAETTVDAGKPVRLKIPNPTLWSPDTPFLYDLTVILVDDGHTVDRVGSYFGMRKISIGKDKQGTMRLMLNGRPLFQYGPLDQGFWPDGLYTAPTDAALKYDLWITKRLGFNMVRKHVKVEPARWYYWCDKLGLLVWQDLPNGDKHAPWPRDGQEIERSAESAENLRRELKALIDSHRNHPSIVMWVPFNEAWGQSETVETTRWLKQYDPTRLVISASGGNDFGVGDVQDVHSYPGPIAPPAENHRAAILGEFGGLGLPIKGHTLLEEKNWGYRTFDTPEKLTNAYLERIKMLRPLIASHLSAAIYTQTTDVEIEINGLLTYDREIVKMDGRKIGAANRGLYKIRPSSDPRVRALASAAAYWRFEDGTPGEQVPNRKDQPDGIAAKDVSGHGNHLYAFGAANAPKIAADVAAKSVPLLGDDNDRALDDRAAPGGTAGTRDLYTDHGKSRNRVDINAYQFTQWTLEASINVAELGRTHGLVGKDGSPKCTPTAPLQLKVRGEDNRIQIEAVDRSGKARSVLSKQPVKADKWYHVAAVCDGKTLRLLVDSGDAHGFVVQGEIRFDGALVNSTGTWTVGRGWHDGQITDDARAMIDEIRLSVVALAEEQLLFATEE